MLSARLGFDLFIGQLMVVDRKLIAYFVFQSILVDIPTLVLVSLTPVLWCSQARTTVRRPLTPLLTTSVTTS